MILVLKQRQSPTQRTLGVIWGRLWLSQLEVLLEESGAAQHPEARMPHERMTQP